MRPEVRFDAGKFVPVEGSERHIPAQLVLLAMGFGGGLSLVDVHLLAGTLLTPGTHL